jgi:hypothetical protein
MPLRRLIFLSSLVLTVGALSPAAALGGAKGTDRPLSGKGTSTTTVNATGTGTSDGTGHLSHLGKFTVHLVATSGTLTGPNTFTGAGTGTTVAANGDKLFSTVTVTGTFTSTTTSEATTVNTITGGTGRFADASGTITITSRSVIIATVGSTATTRDTYTLQGRIRY